MRPVLVWREREREGGGIKILWRHERCISAIFRHSNRDLDATSHTGLLNEGQVGSHGGKPVDGISTHSGTNAPLLSTFQHY